MAKRIVLDFDGVIHSYSSGWQGVRVIRDPPVRGAIEFLVKLANDERFEVAIYSSRSRSFFGRRAMRRWLFDEVRKVYGIHEAYDTIAMIEFAKHKGPAHLMIDDRAYCFRGMFPREDWIDLFKPWNKGGHADV